MDARTSKLFLIATLAVSLTSCSKFGRLSDSEKVATVTIGAGGGGAQHSRSTPQTGGIMVWAEKDDGTQAAFYLPTETATRQVTLTFGNWSFHAVGWDSAFLTGSAHCGSTTTNVQLGTTDVSIPIANANCASDTFLGTSAVRTLKLNSCKVNDPDANGDTSCSSSLAGDVFGFKVKLNSYGMDGTLDSANSPESACQIVSSGYADTSLRVPEGNGSDSPIDATIELFSDAGCSTFLGVSRFNNGFAAADLDEGQVFRNDGTSINTNKNIVFVEHGTESAPSISSVSAQTSRNSLNGDFPLSISGSNFDVRSTVEVGGIDCPVTSHSQTNLICTAPPAYDTQAVDVKVTNHDGQYYNYASVFNYAEDGFGNGIDADRIGDNVTISSPISDTSNVSDTTMTTMFGGRTLQTFRNVQSISGNVLTTRNTFTSADFAVHDSVIVHVAAKSMGSTDCNAGGQYSAGSIYAARVTATNIAAKTVTIDANLPASPNNVNIGNTSRTSADTFCVIQLVRVPDFNNLTIDSTGGAVYLTPPAFNLSSGHGGLLAVRVAGTLTVTGSNAINFNAGNGGFIGGHDGGGVSIGQPGDDVIGSASSPSSSPNGFGGGGANTSAGGGGGGGVAGAGGDGASNIGSHGPAGTFPDPQGGQALFGSGGGGAKNTGTPGGSGGGIALLYAHTITGSASSVSIIADGGMGSGSGSGGGGGGSGGTAYLQVADGEFAPTFTISAAGGSGGGTSAGGGGGGGGVAVESYCAAKAPPAPTTNYNGGAAGAGGSSGANGSAPNDSNSAGTNYCP